MNTPRAAGIVGVGSCVPDRVMTNRELEALVDTSDEWIQERTGIRERRIAAESETVADLATEAGRRAIAQAGLTPADLDLVIVATVSSEHLFPTTANLVQHRLGINGGAFDLAAGCTGFAYGLATGAQFIAAGTAEHVLVIGADVLSRLVNWKDRDTCVLFGDGAGAVVVGPVEAGRGLLAFDLGSDGGGRDLLKLACLNNYPQNGQPLDDRLRFITMNGREVYRFAVNVMGESAQKALAKAGLTSDQVDLFVPHQANIRIIDAAAKRLGMPSERVFVNVERYGNTSAASIPIALAEAVEQGRVNAGDLLVFVGFGAGLTWGSCVLRW